jgi:serine/threonine protein kinase
VWSLGISLIELALGRFPFSESASDDDSDLSEFEGTLSPSRPVPLDKMKDKSKDRKRNRRKSRGVSLQGGGMTMSILELLQHIVNEPAPKLTPEGRFQKAAEDFVNSCLFKDPDQRRTPKDLLVRDLSTAKLRPYLYIYICRTTNGSQMHERQALIWRCGRAHFDRITVAVDADTWVWVGGMGAIVANEQDSRVRC